MSCRVCVPVPAGAQVRAAAAALGGLQAGCPRVPCRGAARRPDTAAAWAGRRVPQGRDQTHRTAGCSPRAAVQAPEREQAQAGWARAGVRQLAAGAEWAGFPAPQAGGNSLRAADLRRARASVQAQARDEALARAAAVGLAQVRDEALARARAEELAQAQVAARAPAGAAEPGLVQAVELVRAPDAVQVLALVEARAQAPGAAPGAALARGPAGAKEYPDAVRPAASGAGWAAVPN